MGNRVGATRRGYRCGGGVRRVSMSGGRVDSALEVAGRSIIAGKSKGCCHSAVVDLTVETASVGINTGSGFGVECTVRG